MIITLEYNTPIVVLVEKLFTVHSHLHYVLCFYMVI